MNTQEITSSLEQRTKIYLVDGQQDGTPAKLTTFEFNKALQLIRLSLSTKNLAGTEGDLFSIDQARIGRPELKPLAGKVSKELHDLVKMSFNELQETFPQHRFDPKVEVFLKLLTESAELRCLADPSEWWNAGALLRFCELLNRFSQEFRERISAPEHVKYEKNQVRRVNSNIASARKFLSEKFSAEPGALPVVLDLYCENRPSNLAAYPAIPFECAQKRRIQLIRLLLKSAKSLGFIGYMWRQDFSMEKGHYCTLVLLFRPSMRDQLSSAIKRVGELWCNLDFVRGNFGCWSNPSCVFGTSQGEPSAANDRIRKNEIEAFIVGLLRTDYYLRYAVKNANCPLFKTGSGDLSYLENTPRLLAA